MCCSNEGYRLQSNLKISWTVWGLRTGNLISIHMWIISTQASFSLVVFHSESEGNRQVSNLVLTCPTPPPPLALNSESLGVTETVAPPPRGAQLFPFAPHFSHLNPFTVFLSVNPAPLQRGQGPL